MHENDLKPSPESPARSSTPLAFFRPDGSFDTDVLIGQVIRDYRIDGTLGRGGMGAVFSATHLKLDRAVAIKWLLPETAASVESRRRFELEARCLAALDHPHIVPVHDFFEYQGMVAIAMGFAQGGSLRQRIKREGPLPEAVARELMIQAASGLAEAHRHGLVHRDVKPENLLFWSEHHLRVAARCFGRPALV